MLFSRPGVRGPSLGPVATQSSVRRLCTAAKARKPDSYWKVPANEKQFLEDHLRWFAAQPSASALVASSPPGSPPLDLWYQISTKSIREQGGATLLKKYKSSLVGALMATFPAHPWQVWRFHRVPKRYWQSKATHLQFFEYLREKLGYVAPEDWYKIGREAIIAHGGGALLANYYHDSPPSFVAAMIPDHKWLYWKFVNVPHSYWKDAEHRRAFVRWLAKEIKGWPDLDQWYGLKGEDFHENGGGGMLAIYYSGSVYRMLQDLYPHHHWHPGLFTKPPNSLWEDLIEDLNASDFKTTRNSRDLIRRYLRSLEPGLNVQNPADWYRVSRKELRKSGGMYMIDKFGGLGQLMPIVYPKFDWDVSKFADRSKKARQRALSILKEAL